MFASGHDLSEFILFKCAFDFGSEVEADMNNLYLASSMADTKAQIACFGLSKTVLT